MGFPCVFAAHGAFLWPFRKFPRIATSLCGKMARFFLDVYMHTGHARRYASHFQKCGKRKQEERFGGSMFHGSSVSSVGVNPISDTHILVLTHILSQTHSHSQLIHSETGHRDIIFDNEKLE